ncbi:hypothetical protein [Pontibacillus salipaludis]|uniref:Uncharacterized protein n=1 Tax=Pontibacillus salipaludis TaxID=1697394 RepID=A0ABQ1Q0A8_9BACI|nr:hypothetical protein [Pontibacillus salipaludis]GGD08222.1 hypothetical protein GCM10011389_14710 [Pontibacillus salipaludis]
MKDHSTSQWKVSQIAVYSCIGAVVSTSIMMGPNLSFIIGAIVVTLLVILVNAIIVFEKKERDKGGDKGEDRDV